MSYLSMGDLGQGGYRYKVGEEGAAFAPSERLQNEGEAFQQYRLARKQGSARGQSFAQWRQAEARSTAYNRWLADQDVKYPGYQSYASKARAAGKKPMSPKSFSRRKARQERFRKSPAGQRQAERRARQEARREARSKAKTPRGREIRDMSKAELDALLDGEGAPEDWEIELAKAVKRRNKARDLRRKAKEERLEELRRRYTPTEEQAKKAPTITRYKPQWGIPRTVTERRAAAFMLQQPGVMSVAGLGQNVPYDPYAVERVWGFPGPEPFTMDGMGRVVTQWNPVPGDPVAPHGRKVLVPQTHVDPLAYPKTDFVTFHPTPETFSLEQRGMSGYECECDGLSGLG